MANERYKLDKKTAELLGAMIAERQRTPKEGPSIRLEGKGRSSGGFWAKITDSNEGRYSWTALKIENGNFVEDENWGKGSHNDDGGFAAEKHQSKYVLKGSIVWLEVFPTEHVYIFDYSASKIATLTTDITARTGSTLGHGTVSVEVADEENLIAENVTVKVFNYKDSPLKLGAVARVLITFVDGQWVVVDQPSRSFWAKLTGRTAWKYSWQQLQENADGTLAVPANPVTGSASGSNFAVSSDGTEHALANSIVRLYLSDKGHYVFDYAPGVITAKLVSAVTIPGRQGATPGSRAVTIEWFNGIALNDQGGSDNITVYNNLRQSVEGEGGSDYYLTLAYGQSVWWLIAVDCINEDESEEE